LEGQVEGYRLEGYPERNGLAASGLMIRNHNSKKVDEFMNRWWEEIRLKSKRDQLSFNYVLWKQPISVGYCNFSHTFTSDFSWGRHKETKMEKIQSYIKKWIRRFSYIRNI